MNGATSPHALPRLGILYPDDGSDADQEYRDFAAISPQPFDVRVVYTQAEHNLDLASLEAFGSLDRLTAGARELAGWKPDGTMWACTSGSFTVGAAGARGQATAVGEITGTSASSTSLALADAIVALDLRRVAVLAPYPEDVTARLVSFLGEFGFGVTTARSLELPSGEECNAISTEEMAGWTAPMDLSQADALFLSCTSLRTMEGLGDLEDRVGVPVLTSNQVTMWQGMRLLGLATHHPWLGSLSGVGSPTGVASVR